MTERFEDGKEENLSGPNVQVKEREAIRQRET